MVHALQICGIAHNALAIRDGKVLTVLSKCARQCQRFLVLEMEHVLKMELVFVIKAGQAQTVRSLWIVRLEVSGNVAFVYVLMDLPATTAKWMYVRIAGYTLRKILLITLCRACAPTAVGVLQQAAVFVILVGQEPSVQTLQHAQGIVRDMAHALAPETA